MSKWILENTKTKEVITIEKPIFKVGRHPKADLSTESAIISRMHAQISLSKDGVLCVVDHKSQNGTYVNDKKITPGEEVRLKHGDHLIFGVFTILKKPTFEGPYFSFRVCKREEIVPAINHVDSRLSEIESSSLRDVSVYTINDDDNLIIISDDDDDDDLSRSQIYHISEKIKSDPISQEYFDPYTDIKEEVREMDYCDEFRQLVDLTEQDHFESTSDLLKVLENQVPSTVATGDTLDDSLQTSDLVNTSESISSEDNIVKQSNEKELCVVLNKISEVKTVKPSITDPHFETRSPRNKKTNSKRKSSEDKNLEATKKQNCNTSLDTTSLRETRKQKLRQIAQKSEKQTPSPKSAKATAKVKLSDSRGNFLLEPTSVPSSSKTSKPRGQVETRNSKNINKDLKRKHVDNSSPKPTKKQNLNTSLDSTQTSTRQQRLQESEKRVSSPKLKENARFGSPKYTKESTKTKTDDACTKPTSAPLSSNNSKDPRISRVNSKPVVENRLQYVNRGIENEVFQPLSHNPPIQQGLGLIHQIGNHQVNTGPSNVRRYNDLEDDIYSVLHWNVAWLLEQNNVDVSPPVAMNRPIVKMPSQFSNLKHYIDVMKPLILLETWEYVYQSTFSREEERNNVVIKVQNERRSQTMTSLDCISHSAAFRSDDLCIANFSVKVNDVKHMKDIFGHIKNVRKSEKLTYFTLIIKSPIGQLTSDRIIVKVVANIASTMRKFRTLLYLERCQLLPYILEPERLTSLMPIVGNCLNTDPLLNPKQKEIIAEASELALGNKPGFYLIHGPPGTGKSTVIARIVLEIIFKAKQRNESPSLLITAPSNAAVNSLLHKLSDARSKLKDNERKLIKLIRVGTETSMPPLVGKYSLRHLTQNNVMSDMKLNQKYGQVSQQMNIDKFLREQLGKRYEFVMKSTEEKVLQGANIICSTLNSSVSYILANRRSNVKFTACIVDEATQCNEIECLFPIMLNVEKFILVGDPQQLPAVVCNKEAQEHGFGKSLFSRIYETFLNNRHKQPMKLLCEQYRMHPEICNYPNRVFYAGKLKSSPVCTNQIQPSLRPYVIFNLVNAGNDNSSEYTNSNEVNFIAGILRTLNTHIVPVCKYSIGIITPYRAQKDLISQCVTEIKMNENVSVNVNTVDSFQGTENDIIIISCVRYTHNSFLANEKRLNVALTRAKQAVYVIGNHSLFKQCQPLYDLREDAKRRNLLHDIDVDPRVIKSLHKYILDVR